MFWVFLILGIIVGLPLVMFALASLASEFGLTNVVVAGFASMLVFAALPTVIALCTIVTVLSLLVVYKLIVTDWDSKE